MSSQDERYAASPAETLPHEQAPLLQVSNLRKVFSRSRLHRAGNSTPQAAVDGVSFVIHRGQTLGLIGESGSGKTTTGRCILRLIEPTSGSVRFDNRGVNELGRSELRRLRRDMQIVFQGLRSSLDPRRTVGASIAEPLTAHSIGSPASRRARVADVLKRVG